MRKRIVYLSLVFALILAITLRVANLSRVQSHLPVWAVFLISIVISLLLTIVFSSAVLFPQRKKTGKEIQ